MVRREIKWSQNALQDKLTILDYWNNKNGNSDYSKKIDSALRNIISVLGSFENLGKKLAGESIRYLVKNDFIIYYEKFPSHIEILHIWDSRRNPADIKL